VNIRLILYVIHNCSRSVNPVIHIFLPGLVATRPTLVTQHKIDLYPPTFRVLIWNPKVYNTMFTKASWTSKPSACLAYSSTLKMEAICLSQALINFYRITGRHILQDRLIKKTAILKYRERELLLQNVNTTKWGILGRIQHLLCVRNIGQAWWHRESSSPSGLRVTSSSAYSTTDCMFRRKAASYLRDVSPNLQFCALT
jgi:hypothetical protein